MRQSAVRVVAASNFTAGVLFGNSPAVVLPPGLSSEWFDVLVGASTDSPLRPEKLNLLTTFRLADWRGKGLPELLDAVAELRVSDVGVTVCGAGVPSTELQQLVARYHFCTLLPGLTDRELAREFAAADIFVLATRTRSGGRASGEGFGLVLLEAQVAGTPVVGPAYGGSHDAYIEGVTGVTPSDESAQALARVLDELLDDPARLTVMGRDAADWARKSFNPQEYARLATERLL